MIAVQRAFAFIILATLSISAFEIYFLGYPQTLGQWVDSDSKWLQAPLFVYFCFAGSILNIIEGFKKK